MAAFSKSFVVISTVLIGVWMTPVYSAAYCALRDPVSKIYKLFPDATSYRSIVHEIDGITQQQVKKTIPFTIHNDELGQHTLYVAMRDQQPLGIIHSRSEEGLWGLVEIVWALDFDFKVVDFMFQRCREQTCKLIESDDFRQIIKEKTTQQLTTMLEQKTIPYPPSFISNEEAKSLAKTIIRSAIKTALVTKISWQDELQSFKKRQ